jgi:hypothetical protein
MDLYKKVMKLYSIYEMEIKLKQVATVKNLRITPTDDFW